jgi:hypothetical protein
MKNSELSSAEKQKEDIKASNETPGFVDAGTSYYNTDGTESSRYSTVQSGLRRGIDCIGDAHKLLGVRLSPVNNIDTYVPGNICDVFALGKFTIGIAAVRGLAHQDHTELRQDSVAFAVTTNERYLIASVADGVSAAKWGHLGAELASKTAVAHVRRMLNSGTYLEDIVWEEVTGVIRESLRTRGKAAFRIDSSDTEEIDRQLAKLIGTTTEVIVADCGDSDQPASFVRASLSGDGYMFWLQDGKFSTKINRDSRDPFLVSHRVNPLPLSPGVEYPIVENGELLNNDAVVLTTDGIGNDIYANEEVAEYLAKHLKEPLPAHELLRISSYLCNHCFDDRSIIILWA